MKPLSYTPPQTKEELLHRYAQGERYFAYIELPEQTDLSGATLADSIFDYGVLSNINLQRANLQNARFHSANVKCTDFRYSILIHADFTEALIESIYLYNANLEDATFQHASYYGLTITTDTEQEVITDLIESSTPFAIALTNQRNRTRLEQRPLWRTYQQVYETLLFILFNHDPIGICMWANPKKETEYSTEVDRLLPQLKRATSLEATRSLVYEELVRCFGSTAKTESQYTAIAQDIWIFINRPEIAEHLQKIEIDPHIGE